MYIVDVGFALPAHRVDQHVITEVLGHAWTDAGLGTSTLERVHRATGVRSRYLCLTPDSYARRMSFTDTNETFLRLGTDLAVAAGLDGLARAAMGARDVDVLVVVSTTGIAAPFIDARVVCRLGLRPSVRRLPIVGLGCVGGAASVARAAELIGGIDEGVALVICVEACSLTFQLDDHSRGNLVSTGLFGDAAASAVIVRRPPIGRSIVRIVDSRSTILEGTEDALGFRVGESGFNVFLQETLPALITQRVPAEIDALLAHHGLGRRDVTDWIIHPGGPAILRGLEHTLGIGRNATRFSWECLRRFGNVSSASVLLVLRSLLDAPPAVGTLSIMLAMGPGVSVEALLLQWETPDAPASSPH